MFYGLIQSQKQQSLQQVQHFDGFSVLAALQIDTRQKQVVSREWSRTQRGGRVGRVLTMLLRVEMTQRVRDPSVAELVICGPSAPCRKYVKGFVCPFVSVTSWESITCFQYWDTSFSPYFILVHLFWDWFVIFHLIDLTLDFLVWVVDGFQG